MNALKKKESHLAIALLAPTLIVMCVIALYPLGSVLITSFTNRTFASSKITECIGLDNYSRLLHVKVLPIPDTIDSSDTVALLQSMPSEPYRYKPMKTFSFIGKPYVFVATDPEFLRALKDTISFTMITVFFETVLGMACALVFSHAFRGVGVLRMIMLIPWAIPTAVSSKMWAWMFGATRTGIINVIMQRFGLTDGQFPFLLEKSTQLWSIICIDVWKTTPFMTLLLIAGLQAIPKELYEAVKVDGAGAGRTFFCVTLPLVRNALMVAMIFRTLDALRVFDLFQIIFAQKRFSLASYTYYQLIDSKAMGYSSASSILIFLLVFLVSLIYVKLAGGISKND
ncbi:carbohydrate ABC transporter permease [Sediminispirochaeta bajacaliforniensis]|uniref:carbohydrate ABC transporter permease n=1 Tax=Sediminispirochaeta bajacaliforniensis TaxID=148 RepID=UPI0003723FB5|nr:sugar ABC transporter permease [Sediminispirochaeta bajacaliforniensis]